MKRLFQSYTTPSQYIKSLLLEGRNSVQIHMLVRDQFPKYEERKLRNLISVLKSKYKKT